MRSLLLVLAVCLVLGGCAQARYSMVDAAPVKVAHGSLTVKPSIAWNRIPPGPFDTDMEESWTQNGPLLDSISFIGGIVDGEAIVKQQPGEARKVPIFRSDMTPQDLVSMVESYYRIRAAVTVFETLDVKPAQLASKPAIEFNFRYVGSDEVKRRGRAVLAIIDDKLYVMSLRGAELHYFDAALPEFQSLVSSASL